MARDAFSGSFDYALMIVAGDKVRRRSAQDDTGVGGLVWMIPVTTGRGPCLASLSQAWVWVGPEPEPGAGQQSESGASLQTNSGRKLRLCLGAHVERPNAGCFDLGQVDRN